MVVILGAVTVVGATAVTDQLNQPTEPSSLDVRPTENGVQVVPQVLNSEILVLRNGVPAGTFGPESDPPFRYFASTGDTLRFVSLREDGSRASVLQSHTVRSDSSYAGRLSLDEQPLQNGQVSVAGKPRPVSITGDVQKVPGKEGQATKVLHRKNGDPSGITIEDVPEYESYTLSFLIRSDGDADDSDNGADDYFYTPVLGWEDGDKILAFSGQNNQFTLLAGGGRNANQNEHKFGTVVTDEREPGANDWNLVTVTRRPGSNPEFCFYTPAKSERCESPQISPRNTGTGASTFFIGNSEFNGEIDEAQLFTEPLSDEERTRLRQRYFGNS
jgi:hypothetical protein